MPKKMLIDATHPEETRVVVVAGNRIDEFDFESAARKPLKGNIFLAKVTRVEPSLQACFVEYGGNRHGFLAFSEIHPDYYQIPVADRQALKAAQRADEEREARRYRDDDEAAPQPAPAEASESVPSEHADATPPASYAPESHEGDEKGEPGIEAAPQPQPEFSADGAAYHGDTAQEAPAGELIEVEVEPIVAETVSEGEASDDEGEDEEEPRARQVRFNRNYKIQEVIKKRQILLVQVVKEERGTKGAALTTYLSLAGRYCVLMPNSGRGGGISRKIANPGDRKRLKEAANELDVPEGMGLIIRTAGASRTKQEIRRDYEYLMRLWDSVRDLTFRSAAPALVYEEGNLIKRSIRDLVTKEIDEILVEGEHGWREARAFMQMLMPSQVDLVKRYDGSPSLFQAFRVESQLDSMFNPKVQLKSGGYIVINQTEALVAIDVNSGRSTREHNIEDTAVRTNLEAAEEAARQVRLRDLAGLIVIDFIDMEEGRNNRAVEKRLKDALRNDRARIQVGRISPFGLLEMSRQRLRPGVVEGSTVACPHCSGTGLIRSVESLALRALRAIEDDMSLGRERGVTLSVPTEVAIYILNHKRVELMQIEDRCGFPIFVEADAELFGAEHEIEAGTPAGYRARRPDTGLTATQAQHMADVDAALEAEALAGDDDAGSGEDERPDEAVRAHDDSDDEAGAPREASQGRREGRNEGRNEGRGGRNRRRRRGGRDGNRDGNREGNRDQRGPRPVVAVDSVDASDPLAVIDHTLDGEIATGMELIDTTLDEGVSEGLRIEHDNGADRGPGADDRNGNRRRRRGRRGGRRNRRDGGRDFQTMAGNEAAGNEAGDDLEPVDDMAANDLPPLPEIADAPIPPVLAADPPKPRTARGLLKSLFGFGRSQAPAEAAPEPAHVPQPEPHLPALREEVPPAPVAEAFAPREESIVIKSAPAPVIEAPKPVEPVAVKAERQIEAEVEPEAEIVPAAPPPPPRPARQGWWQKGS
ncbi:MAG TPA: ribonuclease E/G [Micropepsaceae bacterium]|nr:ribonuclease E/G [Micropepsaceae bacterium]